MLHPLLLTLESFLPTLIISEGSLPAIVHPTTAMHLFKKISHQKATPRLLARESQDHKDDHPASSRDSDAIKPSTGEEADDGPKRFIHLPNELQMTILQYLSYDDIAKIRRTCKLLNTLCSYLLNRGFQQLGIDIDREKLRIKRELPRRESMRRSHRLSRLNDAYAGLDTRFSIMAMTYRKFIDMKVTCFIPGKVLDEFFRIIDILKERGTLAIDIHELLKDLRDLSSMAMEHFRGACAPSLSTSTTGSLSSTYFMSVHPLLRPSIQTPSSLRDVDSCEWRKNVTDKLAQQDKIIRKQSAEIISLKSCIRQLVLVCTQACQVSTQEPSTSSSDVRGDSLRRCYKRIHGRQHSHESCARKRPRSDDSADEDRTLERLV
ncbi:F-box domain protein [Ostertagia ostertagi]